MRPNRRDVSNFLTLLLGRMLTPARLKMAGAVAITQANATEVPSVRSKPPIPTPVFPISVSGRWRCLEDAAGHPFLVQGEASWSLIVQLKKPEVDLYLRDRKARGFNTILVNLIEHYFAKRAPNNAYGHAPFAKQMFSDLNEDYFAHADWVLRRAAEEGFLVLLAPAYLGFGGGGEGWYTEMGAAGVDRLHAYGRAVAARYKDLSNIVWVHCGDFDPPNKLLVEAIVAGIREVDQQSLQTIHGGPETDILAYWSNEPWIAFGNVYTYKPVWEQASQRFAGSDRKPFILMESAYENEHDATERRVRTQAYQAILTGACGQLFGNNPIWAFGAKTSFGNATNWEQALDSRGSQSMTHLYNLIAPLPWWRLVPDLDGKMLLNGQGRRDDRTVAAVDSERTFALLYMPSSRSVTLNLEQLGSMEFVGQWYDPSSGLFHQAEPWSLHHNTAEFQPPTRNAATGDDWVLLLNARA